MARGITGILFTDEDLETGQIKEYPSLKNCRVYGVMANSLFAYIEAGIVEESRNRSEILKEKGYKNSGIKWVYGRVNSLEKGGIEWLHWFKDTNQNNKKDPGEQNIENEPLIKISGSDLYGVGGAYNRANSISLWFDKDEKFLPALYWVEPFLVHPELHFGAAPKGMFMMPAQHPGPYEVTISGNHKVHRGAFSRILASTVKQAKYTYLYYGENIEFFIETLHIPEGEKLSIEIWDESSDKTLYSTTATVTKNKPAQEEEETDELQDYLEQFKGFAEVTVPLDISKMPEDQKKKEARVFKVQISYLPSDFSLVNEMGAVVAASEISSAVISSRIRKELANKPRAQSVTGYIQIMYEDTEAYINTRNAPVNQVVERETPVLLTPKGEPCQYTQIKAQRYKDEGFTKKDGVEAIIFDETKMILPKSQPTIEVIAGDAKPAFLKLMADLHTNEACRPGTHTRGGKSVFYFHKEAGAEQQNLTVVNIKEKEIDLTLPYIYIKDKKVANMVSSFPFNYFCLRDVKPIPYSLMIETCRYKNDILINVYPDIKWWVNIKFNAKNPLWVYKTPNYGYRTGRNTNYNRSVNGRYQSERGKTYDNSYEIDFEIGVKYNEEEYKFDTEEGIPLLNAALFFVDAWKIIKEYLFADEAEAGEQTIANGTATPVVRDDRDPRTRLMTARYQDRKSKGLPIKIIVDRPSFSGGLYAQFLLSSMQNNKVGYAYSLNFAASPLFKITGKLDLLFYAQFIPYIGQGLKAINKVVEGVNFLTLGAVKIDYYLNIAASLAFDLDWTRVEYHSIDGWNENKRIGVTTKIKLWLEAGVNLKVDFKGIGSGEAEGAMTGTASIDILLTYDNVKQKADADVNFKGLKVKIWLKAKIKVEKGKNEGPPPEPDTKPDYIKDLIKGMKKPWKINIM